jgi:hypothetical protein
MAKQTFTTGQVLTAAQMTSLQETAMGGGAASTKTASYVLVAADAGTTVAMNAAGSTTITVNTGLFSAGDTVFIQNVGAGSTTITAGTATINTAGSLILPQYDAGILYFTSASAAIFYDYIQVGAASPLTTKGDLYTYSTSDTRIGVGANTQTLIANSAQATGLQWVANRRIVQVVTGSTSTQTGSSSATYADTTLTATITPTLATSEILVFVTQAGCQKFSSATSMALRLVRGATTILQMANTAGGTGSTAEINWGTIAAVYLDAPATTSATTYKTQFNSTAGSAQTTVQHNTPTSTIVLMEVGA